MVTPAPQCDPGNRLALRKWGGLGKNRLRVDLATGYLCGRMASPSRPGGFCNPSGSSRRWKWRPLGLFRPSGLLFVSLTHNRRTKILSSLTPLPSAFPCCPGFSVFGKARGVSRLAKPFRLAQSFSLPPRLTANANRAGVPAKGRDALQVPEKSKRCCGNQNV